MNFSIFLTYLAASLAAAAGLHQRQVDAQTSGIQDTSAVSEPTAAGISSSITAATTTAAPIASAEPSPIDNYDTSSDVDTDAGASGSQGNASFSLSQGGLIAIIVVVVLVVIVGVASTVLFVLAKRRQWNIRQSIKRASRRLTGRGAPTRSERQSKRVGLQMSSIPASRGHKRGVVIGVDHDVEMGEGAKREGSPRQKAAWNERFKGID